MEEKKDVSAEIARKAAEVLEILGACNGPAKVAVLKAAFGAAFPELTLRLEDDAMVRSLK